MKIAKQWTVGNILALLGLIVAIIATILALISVPQVQQIIGLGNPLGSGPSDTEIRNAIDRYETYALSTFQVLGKEQCPLISGDQSKGIKEKWLVRTNYAVTGYPAYDRTILFVSRNGNWEYFGLWNTCPN